MTQTTLTAPVATAAGGRSTRALLGVARLFARVGERGLAVYSIATGVLAPAVGMWPELHNAGLRLATASALMFVWVTVVALWPRRRTSAG